MIYLLWEEDDDNLPYVRDVYANHIDALIAKSSAETR